MQTHKIHVIGYDEVVLLFGLLGIEGTIIENPNEFLKRFDKLTKNSSIGMIIVVLDLPQDTINYLARFKLTKRRPFVFYIPDIFERNIEEEDAFLNNILKSIGKIIS